MSVAAGAIESGTAAAGHAAAPAPAVSIVMASYGRLSLLEPALASALAQDHASFEVILVDDGSDEATRAWLRGAEQREPRLRVVFQQHEGVAAARARGLTEARGALVCILDSDDTLAPHALRRLAREFEGSPDTQLAHAQIRELRPNGSVAVQAYRAYASARAMLWATLLKPRVPFKHSGTMFRRAAALELGSYDRSLPCKVDIDLYLKFMRAGHRPRLVPEPLVDFRMHTDSISRNRWLGMRVWFTLIDRYGPRSRLVRLALKAARIASEATKQLYVECASLGNRRGSSSVRSIASSRAAACDARKCRCACS
jgi:GT2 family glycosyltransferase